MTGEVTLRGRVLPIGGLKEKLLAALRSGIKTVLIPEENVRDLKEIPEIVTKGMEIVPVTRMDQVLKVALTKEPEPIEWTYDEKAATPPASIEPPVDGEETTGLPH
jgi:ATP-dependent Lon protease